MTESPSAWQGERLDPELAAALMLIEDVDPYDLEAHRAHHRRQHELAPPVEDPRVRVGHIEPGSGAPVRLRTYWNVTLPGPAPLLVWLHGGAFALGFCELDDDLCTWLAAEVGCHVIAPDYRLAPEHPFPSGLDDTYGTVRWVAEHAAELGVDPALIAVGGGSAGGALAAATALRARDQGGPGLCFQLLIYPVIDDRMDSPSMIRFTDTPIFDRPQAELMWRRYLGGDRTAVSPYAAPGRAEDLSGLPPAYILTAELDPLRDEGIGYGVRMIHQGGRVELHHFPETFHGFDIVARSALITQRAYADIAAALKRALRR